MMPSRVLPKMASSADSTKLRNNAKVCSMSRVGWRPVILVPPPLPRPWGRLPQCRGKSKAFRVPDPTRENHRESALRAPFWCENRPPRPLWVRHDRQNGDRMEFPDRRPPVRGAPGVGVLGLALVLLVEEQPAADPNPLVLDGLLEGAVSQSV